MTNERKETEEAFSSEEEQNFYKKCQRIWSYFKQRPPLLLSCIIGVVIIFAGVDPNNLTISAAVIFIGVSGFVFVRQKGKQIKEQFLSPAASGAKRKLENLPLFLSIFLWCVVAVIAFLFVTWIWGDTPPQDLLPSPGGEQNNPYEFVKIALYMVGGIGAVAYLVLKYQEGQSSRRSEKLEGERFVNEKLQAAINQLADDSPTARIAGVYALADIADSQAKRKNYAYKQRVVDILCGYLRTDRGADNNEDKAVESTIFNVINEHLEHRNAASNAAEEFQKLSWSKLTFDFHGAVIHENVSFSDAIFYKPIIFRDVTFCQQAVFVNASFRGEETVPTSNRAVCADFSGETRFDGPAVFVGAAFSEEAWFSDATFGKEAWFAGTTFSEEAQFPRAVFGQGAMFNGATFDGRAWFSTAVFVKDASFSGATFGEEAWFSRTTFAGNAMFGGNVTYSGATFVGDARFSKTIFAGNAQFSEETFDEATFGSEAFNKIAARFSEEMRFSEEAFSEKAQHENEVCFKGVVQFEPMELKKAALFDKVKCNALLRKQCHFDEALLDGDNLPAGAQWTLFITTDRVPDGPFIPWYSSTRSLISLIYF